MKFTAVAALAAIGAVASPVAKRAATYTDTDVLKYALTLEHLEKQFYEDALTMYSAQDFQNSGYPDWVRGRMSQIHQHESSHVALLSAALGNMSIPACTYNFGLSSIEDFIVKAAFIENLGVSAYSGANQYITTPLYSTVAAVILSVEGRHQGFWSGPVLKHNDWTGPYDTPLGLDMVYTLAAQLISSCPSNASLPLHAATPLVSSGAPFVKASAGSMVPVSYSKSSSSVAGPVNAFIYNGLGSKMIDYSNGQITLPSDIQGYSYVVLANTDSPTSVNWMNTVAGPLEVSTPFDAFVSNPGFMNPFNS